MLLHLLLCHGNLSKKRKFFIRAHPFRTVNAKKLLQVFAIFLNAFPVLKGRAFRHSASASFVRTVIIVQKSCSRG